MAGRVLIAVCGTGQPAPDTDEAAERVGALLAQRGATVVCGGLGGVMEAAARGAAAAGGMVVGLLPGTNPDEGNAHLTVALPTGLGEVRNLLIARACQGMVAVGGGYGTLSEIGFMLRLGRPVVGLHTWRLQPPESSALQPCPHAAESPQDAVAWLFGELGLD